MAKISNKQRKAIAHTSVFMDVIREYEGDYKGAHWLDNPPALWDKQQNALFDMMAEAENQLKNKILKIVWPE